jgi:hypothetical protein
MIRSLRVPLLLGVLTLLVWGCPSVGTAQSCGMIPPGGCPVETGGTCQDPTCTVLYACENVTGTWVATQTCMRDGGVGTGGAGAGGGSGGGPMHDAGPCTTPAVDLGPDAGLTMGCTPDLQPEEGDCPIAAAEPCVQEACLTGCSDFFICSSITAPGCPSPPCWVDVAYCDESGDFVVTQ